MRSGYVKALRNVLSEPFISSTNGSLIGYLRLPQSTECSRMCGTPLLSSTGVRSTAPKVLFSSSGETQEMTSAPVLSWT